MGMQQCQAALEEAYVSFAEGEPQRFIDLVAPEAVVMYFGPSDRVPWAGRYRGPEGCPEMVARIGEHVEVREFQANEFLMDGDRIMVLGIGRGVGRKSRVRYRANWAHYVRFRDAKIIEFRVYIDTFALAATVAVD